MAKKIIYKIRPKFWTMPLLNFLMVYAAVTKRQYSEQTINWITENGFTGELEHV